MQQLLLKSGELVVDTVPAPPLEPGRVLVQTAYSCISVGTEMAGVSQGGLPIWRRAMKERSRVPQVVNMLRAVGVKNTLEFVQSRLSAARPLGYSLSGVVIGLGDGVEHIQTGDLVACGGAECANHAEVVSIPKNLVVPVPHGVSARDASMATVGAIALQGVRRADPTLGETVVVLGLGLIGLLTVQILRANGCTVVGIDLDEKRVSLARAIGANFAYVASDDNDLAVLQHSHGYGADATIVTAASKSDQLMSSAFGFTRKRGRVVIVGDVGLGLRREDFYAKEADVLISCSYGPGRYDRLYEEAGLDYPLPYVRWTEARNMECFLDLVAQGRLSIDVLSPGVFPLSQAANAYSALADKESAPLAVFLSYGDTPPPGRDTITEPRGRLTAAPHARLRMAIVGAGAFAGATHVPNLRKLQRDVEIVAVVGRSGVKAAQVARQCDASVVSTNLEEVLDRDDVDAVLIATRHDSHAKLVRLALERGKHVLVEKPTVITREELQSLDELVRSLGACGRLPALMTGYNRRFSSFSARVRELVRENACPIVQTYRMAAGLLPRDHWTYGPEGGGRNLGEACHVYDLFTYVADSPVKNVTSVALGGEQGAYRLTDNFVTTVLYENGSVCTLTYTAQGSSKLEKERWEVFSGKTAIVIDNWTQMTTFGGRVDRVSLRTQDKGFERELEAFVKAARTGAGSPIPWSEQVAAANIALTAQERMTSGGTPCAE